MPSKKIIEKCHIVCGWPPNSPDLSPIEMMWSIIKYRINSYKEADRPKKIEDLKNAVKREWDSISIEVVNKLVASFKKRLELCIQVGGRSISHIIKYTRSTVPSNIVVAEEARPQRFTPELDESLMKEYRIHGRAWTRIGRVVNMDPHLVKYRIVSLLNKTLDTKTPKIGQMMPEDDPKTLDDDETNDDELDTIPEKRPFVLPDIYPLHHHALDIERITNTEENGEEDQDYDESEVIENLEKDERFVHTSHSDDDIILTAANSSE